MHGLCAPAFADDATAMPTFGAIGGGFFTSDPVAPANAGMGAAAPQALQANAGPDRCGPAVDQASAGYHLPAGLLRAIANVESGRLNLQTGAMQPWPWTIDANGAGFVYPSEQAAAAAAQGFQAAGITSLDVGCLQVNLAQHPDAFASLPQAFDPAANANYAARFLTALEQKFGNWPQAVAAYHSQTPGVGEPYAAKVYAQWQGASGATSLMAEPVMAATTLPEPALPQTAFEMSSLIPSARVLQPEHGVTGRSLESYRERPVAIAAAILPQG